VLSGQPVVRTLRGLALPPVVMVLAAQNLARKSKGDGERPTVSADAAHFVDFNKEKQQ
jgi:hypothetical protein